MTTVTRHDLAAAHSLKTIMDRYSSGEVLAAIVLYLQEYVDDFPGVAHKDIGHLVHLAKEDMLKLELGYD